MRVASVDFQGFNLTTDCGREFFPKEMTIIEDDGNLVNHYLFKPPREYRCLSEQDKKNVKYLEQNYHGLRYSSGYIDYRMLDNIVKDHLLHVNTIYVRGHQKVNCLQKLLSDLNIGGCTYPSIVNVENFDGFVNNPPPKYQNHNIHCGHHVNLRKNMYVRCSQRNCVKLYRWVYSQLPR